MAEVRQRKTGATESTSSPVEKDSRSNAKDARQGISTLDIFRILITLCVSSLALSYFTTNGESVLWGYRPWFTKLDQIKAALQGEQILTSQQLALYNGTDKTLPIYIAINGTIFDVSISPHTYGPGGSYNNFAGVDATRAFVTGCFAEDKTGDMRGAEEMYIPLDDPEEVISSGARKSRREQETREAKKKVRAEVDKWEKFYGNSKKYFRVGKLTPQVHDGPPPELCERASKARPKRNRESTT
ncbi:MAG: hypothetical protein Q9160_007968 [Pyrenula sp. 1 TL-2023]